MKLFRWLYYGMMILTLVTIGACEDNIKTDTGSSIKPLTNNPGSVIPYVIIDTEGKTIIDEPKIKSNITIYDKGTIVFDSPIGIEIRGSTSQLFPKKSYGFELKDDNYIDKQASFLNFPEEEDFILLGPYNDRTLIRDVLSYDIARHTGMYATLSRFVELQLNNTYQGTYIILEKIKRDKNRVTISDIKPTDNNGEELTGGYVFKIDKISGDSPSFTSDFSFRSQYTTQGNANTTPPYNGKGMLDTYYTYHDPKPDEISAQQKAYLSEYVHEMETAVLNDDLTHIPRKYEDYLDLESFVNYVITNELTANVDAYRISTYLHKDRNDKIHFGPVWDFNITYGIEGRARYDRWVYRYNDYIPNDYYQVHFIWYRLMDDPYVKAKFKERWQSLRAGALSDNNLSQYISDYVQLLKSSGAMDANHKLWNVMNINMIFNDLNLGSYDAEITYMRDWLKKRTLWIDDQVSKW